MSWVGFERMIPVLEWTKAVHVLTARPLRSAGGKIGPENSSESLVTACLDYSTEISVMTTAVSRSAAGTQGGTHG
jgi:hypothetical protein